MLQYRCGFITRVVKTAKIGNVDVVWVVVNWAIHCVMSALCAVEKRSVLV